MEEYNLNERDILSKLALIEKHLSGFNSCFYEVSKEFSPINIISVQKEASKMMKFVGLLHHVACISYTNTKEGTGGNIELDNSETVFIDINQDYKNDKEKTLAVMAHEICHKVLFVHGLYYPNNCIENELLTDISTVYVGFGKLSLNGCYNERISNSREWKGNQWVDVTTTHKEFIGYLSLKQFAFVYNIVCNVYRIPDEIKMSGLSRLATNEVRCSAPQYVHTTYSLSELRQKLRITQEQDAEMTRCIILIESIISELKLRIKKNHKQFNEDFVLPYAKCNNNEYVEKQIVATELFSKYSGLDNEKTEIICLLQKFIDGYTTNHEINNSILFDIECPCCGYKKQKGVKEQKELFIRCPNCGYMFLWSSNEKGKHQNNSKAYSFHSFFKKIFLLFKKE